MMGRMRGGWGSKGGPGGMGGMGMGGRGMAKGAKGVAPKGAPAGARAQFVNVFLAGATDTNPVAYAAGIPQALRLMNSPIANNPAAAKDGDIRLDRRVVPHPAVHRGRHDHRTACGEQERREEVVGDAVRRLRQNVGGGGRHHDGRRTLRERYVLDRLGTLRVEQVREYRTS